MADARETRVLQRLVDIHSNANFVLDRFDDQGPAVGRGEAIKIPNIAQLEIFDDGSVPRLAADRNDATPVEITLNVDQEPWIPIQLPKMDQIQILNGGWVNQVGDQSLIMLRNHMDSMVIDDYVAGELLWVASGVDTYVYNTEADSLEPKNLLVARGKALRAKGTMLSSLLWIFDSLAAAAVMGFQGWVGIASTDTLGPQTAGRIYGIPLVETQAVRLSKEFAVATAAVAAGVLTLTFAENPGFFVGEPITTTNLQVGYNVEDEPVVSVSADGLTVTTASAGANDADVSGANDSARAASATNLLVDRNMIHRAIQAIPDVEVVKDIDTTGHVMQVSTIFGFIGRAGRAWGIKSPENDI